MLADAFIRARDKLSVPMNGLLVPFSRVAENFSRFCRPLTFHNPDPIYELSLSGTAFAVRYLGRNFLISTRHQFGEGPHARTAHELVIVLPHPDGEGSLAIGADGDHRLSVGPPGLETPEDLAVVSFSDEVGGRDLRPHFLALGADQVRSFEELPAGARPVGSFVVGFTTESASYEVEYDDEFNPQPAQIVSRRALLSASPTAGPDMWDQEGLSPLQIHPEQVSSIRHPDGLSGSPLVTIWQDAQEHAHLALSGVVFWASPAGRLNVYPADRLRMALDGAVAAGRPPFLGEGH